jgi:acetoin utilization deacetylase AcuC-like enzyme
VTIYRPISTAYSDAYQAETPTPSMRKLRLVAQQARDCGFANLIPPTPVRREGLITIHDMSYVDSILTGRGELADCAFGFWGEAYRDGVLAICGGNLLAAELALQNGIAANVGGGFHHARPSLGAGFCTFNGLALVAALNPHLRVLVIDCDEHAGDGTAAFAETLPNLTNFSICGTHLDSEEHERSFVRHVSPRDQDAYRVAVREALECAAATCPDLVIYQAGMDCHENDPLGRSKMTGEFLAERDETIMATLANELHIPFFFVLAGGYQEPVEKFLVPLHLKTFEIAAKLNSGGANCNVPIEKEIF